MTALAGLAFARCKSPQRLCESLLDAQGAARDAPTRWWQDGDVAFGRRLAATLPEDAFDAGIVIGASGRLVLAADIRLDNRNDLLAALGPGPASAGLSDADVAMRAFERWGLDALPRLIGDFALALWDVQQRRLHLARDYLGARPLFLHRGPQGVAFASTAQALTRIAGSRPNPLAALHFLADLPTPAGQSFYHGIERVEPGHVVSITPDGSTQTDWWRPDLSEARFASIGDAIEGFRALLDDSVRCRLRGASGRVATHLSSGFDSGGVTVTAARLNAGHGEVHAYTAVPPPGYAGSEGRIDDEGPAAAAIAALYPGTIRHHRVVAPPLSPLDRLDACFELYGRPMPNLANHVWLAAISDAVRRAGIGVLLIGAMGNLTLSHPGGEALGELVRRGRIGRAVRHGLERRGVGEGWRQIAGAAARPWRRRGPDPRGPALIAPGASVGKRGSAPHSALARITALRRVDGGEFGKAVLAGWGIDVRDPTADRRIAEFCLKLPVEYFAADGVSRGFARRALADRLPAATLAATRRARQAGWWHLPMRERIDQVRDEIERIAACAEATDLLDIAEMRRLAADWPQAWPDDRTDIHYRMRLLPAIAVGHFLRRSAA